MSIALRYRPQRFSELSGLKLPIKLLKAISKDPFNSPHCLLFYGDWGVGKTTVAKIFGRVLNCTSGTQDCCCKCEACQDSEPMLGGHVQFYDSSFVGHVDDMREISETFSVDFGDRVHVVIFDEVHLFSSKALSALLTIVEENRDTFFIFCTTEQSKVLDTLRSRALCVEFKKLSGEEIRELVLGISEKEGLTVPESVLAVIERRAGGHARDALQLLSRFKLLGDDFDSGIKILDNFFVYMLNSIGGDNNEQFRKAVLGVSKFPVEIVRQDFELFIVKLADTIFVDRKMTDKRDLVFRFLQYQDKLRSMNDWVCFFYSLQDLVRKV